MDFGRIATNITIICKKKAPVDVIAGRGGILLALSRLAGFRYIALGYIAKAHALAQEANSKAFER